MKSYIFKTSDELHGAIKALSKAGPKLEIQELIELGLLLVLAEKGKISSMQEAEVLGARHSTVAIFSRCLRGELW